MKSVGVLVVIAAALLIGQSSQEEPTQNVACDKLLPGLTRLSRGIDITAVDLFPTDITGANGFGQALFDFTCNHGSDRQWSHPQTPDVRYPIPDQVSTINSVPGGAMNQKITFQDSTDDVKHTLSVQLGLDAPTKIYGDYSLNLDFKRLEEQLLATNRTAAEVSAYVSAVQMDFVPRTALKTSANFREAIKSLAGAKFADADSQFSEVLDNFGTHYFESGIFGGYLRQETLVDDSYRYSTDTRDIAFSLGASYQKMIKGKFDINDQKRHLQQTFERHTETSRYYYGGNLNLLDNIDEQKFDAWQKSVPTDPWLIGGKVQSIENLIEDEAVRSEIKTAIGVRMTKAYLQEMSRSLRLIRRPLTRAMPELTKTIDESSKAINELLAQTIPNDDLVKALSKTVGQLKAEAQALKDESYLERYHQKLRETQDYELFCKTEVANRCDHEKKRDVNDEVAHGAHLMTLIGQTLNFARVENKAERKLPDTKAVRKLIAETETFIQQQQTELMEPCREKVFCQMCKSVVITSIDKDTCNTPHIKKIVDVHT